jgi:hypothetical protein
VLQYVLHMASILRLLARTANVPMMMPPIARVIMAVMATQSSNPIEVAERRHKFVFAIYIGILIFTALLIAFMTWLEDKAGSGVQDAIRQDADTRIHEAIQGVEQLRAANFKLATDLEREKGKVAGLQTDAAKQQTRAATAERNLLELRERIKPRRLTDQQSSAFVAELKKSPANIKFGYTNAGGDEGFTFLKQLLPLFKEARWKIPEGKMADLSNHLDIQVIGVGILVPDPRNTDQTLVPQPSMLSLSSVEVALRGAFRSVGIEVQFINWYATPDMRPELVIGSKPNP